MISQNLEETINSPNGLNDSPASSLVDVSIRRSRSLNDVTAHPEIDESSASFSRSEECLLTFKPVNKKLQVV